MQTAKTRDLKPSDWKSVCYLVKPDYKQLTSSILGYSPLKEVLLWVKKSLLCFNHRSHYHGIYKQNKTF